MYCKIVRKIFFFTFKKLTLLKWKIFKIRERSTFSNVRIYYRIMKIKHPFQIVFLFAIRWPTIIFLFYILFNCGHVDVGTCPHQVLAATLTLSNHSDLIFLNNVAFHIIEDLFTSYEGIRQVKTSYGTYIDLL